MFDNLPIRHPWRNLVTSNRCRILALPGGQFRLKQGPTTIDTYDNLRAAMNMAHYGNVWGPVAVLLGFDGTDFQPEVTWTRDEGATYTFNPTHPVTYTAGPVHANWDHIMSLMDGSAALGFRVRPRLE